MDVKTKFEPGDSVWLMADNKMKESRVVLVNIKSSLNEYHIIAHDIQYQLTDGVWFSTYRLFATTEDLSNSLIAGTE